MTAPERIWLTNFHKDEYGAKLGRGVISDLDHGDNPDYPEYIRADLARPMTVAEAAKVLLDNTPNPVFDKLKYPMMGEFKQSITVQDEDGDETWRDVSIKWTTIKEILAAALRALSEG